MEEVASRLGYGAGNSLCAWEPRLCARLIERRRRFAEQSKKALKNRLKVVLKENPPPSLREVMRGSVSPGLFPAIFPRLIAPFLRGIGSFSGVLNPQIALRSAGG